MGLLISPRKFLVIERTGNGFTVEGYEEIDDLVRALTYAMVARRKPSDRPLAISIIRSLADVIEEEWIRQEEEEAKEDETPSGN